MKTGVNIHPSAIIHPTAEIGEGVIIHPYVVISEDVKIGAGTEIFPHAYIEHSDIGENCKIGPGAAIGTAPQDWSYKGEKNPRNNRKRVPDKKNATVNRGTGEVQLQESATTAC